MSVFVLMNENAFFWHTNIDEFVKNANSEQCWYALLDYHSFYIDFVWRQSEFAFYVR